VKEDCGNFVDDNCDGLIDTEDSGCEYRCLSVLNNGDFKDKIDVVFMPNGFLSDAEIDYFKDTILPLHIGTQGHGILSMEPFTSNSDKFNFWYIDEKIDYDFTYDDPHLFFDNKHISEDLIQEKCPYYDEMIVLDKDSIGGKASTGYHWAISPAGPDYYGSDAEYVTVHEFGHSFGGLADEYANIRAFYPSSRPNSDVYGCADFGCTGTSTRAEPPWQRCWSYEFQGGEVACDADPDCKWYIEKDECILASSQWGNYTSGLNCPSGVECWHNCQSTSAFRSSEDSIMRSSYSGGFNRISSDHMNNIMKCCYPESLADFNSVSPSCVDWIKGNYYRFRECATYEE